jgi:hypothetical protein
LVENIVTIVDIIQYQNEDIGHDSTNIMEMHLDIQEQDIYIYIIYTYISINNNMVWVCPKMGGTPNCPLNNVEKYYKLSKEV